MITKPQTTEYGEHFSTYVRLVPEGDIREMLTAQLQATTDLFANLSDEQGNFRYAEGKWTVKEVLGHIADTERVMAYRLLTVARGDKTPLPGFDENVFVEGANFAAMPMSELIEDYQAVRRATLTLLRGLTDEALLRMGISNQLTISARALVHIIVGHELHHLNVLKEKYGIQ
ncbi:DinB family protein [Paenibacillus guangzhouensis]|uniref:DinB family protein n=1 Tax=Paenibacillus guangzhouensis TaxID=1473112 RepID=UPI00187B85DB|nr:DinB family protein [Paenibacillus guangzhouensis]